MYTAKRISKSDLGVKWTLVSRTTVEEERAAGRPHLADAMVKNGIVASVVVETVRRSSRLHMGHELASGEIVTFASVRK